MSAGTTTQSRPADGPVAGRRRRGHCPAWQAHAEPYARWLERRCGSAAAGGAPDAEDTVRCHRRTLAVAREAIAQPGHWRDWWSGVVVDRVYHHLHLVDGELLRVESPEELTGRTEDVLALAERYLPRTDRRRAAVEARFARDGAPAGRADGPLLSCALLAAHAASDDAHRRLRQFRNGLLHGLAILVLLAVALAVVGAFRPTWTDLWFDVAEQPVVCPVDGSAAAPGHTAVLLLVGLLGSAVTGVVALRDGHGSSAPYAFPVLLFLLKLPLGALTGWLGLLLIHGEFVPGLSRLDTPGQVLAWTAVFGAGQQAVSRFVDRRASEALAGTRGRTAAEPPAAPPADP